MYVVPTFSHARRSQVLIACNQTLGNLGLPPARDAVSLLSQGHCPMAHSCLLDARRCMYPRGGLRIVLIRREANLDPRVTQLGWRLAPSIHKLTDVHTPWYARPKSQKCWPLSSHMSQPFSGIPQPSRLAQKPPRACFLARNEGSIQG